MGKLCVFPCNQKSLEKYVDDRVIDEIDLGRMVSKYCLSYIFSWYIKMVNHGIYKLGI